MNITILAVGKIKESFYRDAISEYSKRLSRYCTLKIIETADEKTPDNASPSLVDQIKEREGNRLLERIRPGSHVVALAIKGKKMTSEQLADHIERLTVQGTSDICFVIGGSLGLSDRVLARADEQLSFSDMTFPHQLMRVILAEQIYRSFRIIHHEPYHK